MNNLKQWKTTIFAILIGAQQGFEYLGIELPTESKDWLLIIAGVLLLISGDPKGKEILASLIKGGQDVNEKVKEMKSQSVEQMKVKADKLNQKVKDIETKNGAKIILFFMVFALGVFANYTPSNAQLNYNARRISADTIRGRSTSQGGQSGRLELPYNYDGSFASIAVNDTLLHEWVAKNGGGTAGGGGLTLFEYTFNYPDTLSPPALGEVNYNKKVDSLVTEIYVSNSTSTGFNIFNILDNYQAGATLAVGSNTDAQKGSIYQVNSFATSGTLETDFATYSVTWTDRGTSGALDSTELAILYLNNTAEIVGGDGISLSGSGNNTINLGGNISGNTSLLYPSSNSFIINTTDAATEQMRLELGIDKNELVYNSVSEDFYAIVGQDKAFTTGNIGGMFLVAGDKAFTATAGMSFRRDGIIYVGDVFNGGDFNYMRYFINNSAIWGAQSDAVKDRIIPDIGYVRDSLVNVSPFWHDGGITTLSSNNIINGTGLDIAYNLDDYNILNTGTFSVTSTDASVGINLSSNNAGNITMSVSAGGNGFDFLNLGTDGIDFENRNGSILFDQQANDVIELRSHTLNLNTRVSGGQITILNKGSLGTNIYDSGSDTLSIRNKAGLGLSIISDNGFMNISDNAGTPVGLVNSSDYSAQYSGTPRALSDAGYADGRSRYFTGSISSNPTQTQMVTILGSVASRGTGFKCTVVGNAGTGSGNVYLITNDGTNWAGVKCTIF